MATDEAATGGSVTLEMTPPQHHAVGLENDGNCFQHFIVSCRQKRKLSLVSIFNQAIMCLVICGYGMSYSLYAPFFPDAAGMKGMGPTAVGFLFGTNELVKFIGSPLAGKAISRHIVGLRFMIWAGMLLAGGATMLFGIVGFDGSPNGTIYIVQCFAVRIVEATGISLYLTSAYCIAGNMFPDNISFVYSVMETFSGIGMMIGPSAGGLLYEVAGFYLPFVVIGATMISVGHFVTAVLPKSAIKCDDEDDDNDKKKTPDTNEAKPAAVVTKKSTTPWSRLYRLSFRTWIISLGEMITAILSAYPEPTLSLFLKENLHLEDEATIGSIYLASSIVYTVACLIVGHLADRFPKKVYLLMSSGAIVSAFSFVMMGPPPFVADFIVPSVGLTTAGQVMLFAGIPMLMIPVPQALMGVAKEIGFPEGLETSAMIAGLYMSLWSLGGLAGPIIAGALLESVGFQWGTTIMTIISCLLLPFFIFSAVYKHR